MADLADLKPQKDTVEVLLKHPVTEADLMNDDGTQMTITVYLPHAKEYKEAQYALQNFRLKKIQKNRGRSEFTAQELEGGVIDVMAQTIASWNITYGGKKPKLSVATAKEVLAEYYWIRDQITEAVDEAQVFTKA